MNNKKAKLIRRTTKEEIKTNYDSLYEAVADNGIIVRFIFDGKVLIKAKEQKFTIFNNYVNDLTGAARTSPDVKVQKAIHKFSRKVGKSINKEMKNDLQLLYKTICDQVWYIRFAFAIKVLAKISSFKFVLTNKYVTEGQEKIIDEVRSLVKEV